MLSIWLTYGIPSVLLILFFLNFLRRKEFKYSFYRIVQCDMLLNLFCYLNTWTMRFCHVGETFRTMLWVHYHVPQVFLVAAFFAYFFYNAQALSVIIMSVQRLWTSKYYSGNEFWTHYYLHSYVLLIVICLLFTFPVICWELYLPYRYDPEKQVFHSGTVEPMKSQIFAMFFLFQSFIYFAVIFVVNIWTIFTVKKHLANITTSLNTKNMIRNLTTIAFINTIVFFCVTMWQILGKFVFIQFTETTDFHIIMVMSDVLSLSLPYTLLTFDKNVRNTLLKGMTGKVATTAESGSVY